MRRQKLNGKTGLFTKYFFSWIFQFQVKMVRITERVVHTYFARIFFHKVTMQLMKY